MYIAFIDESGKPTKKERSPFVLAALIVRDSELNRIRKEVNRIKLKYGLDPDVEIHARDIVHGKRGFKNVDMRVRKSLLDDVFNLLKSLDITLISTVILKKRIVGSPKPDSIVREEVEAKCYELLVERLVLFLEKKAVDDWLLMVIDETYTKHDLSIRRNIERVVQHGFFASRWPASRRVFMQPLFVPSKLYEPLQLADIIAYTVFKKYSKPRSAIFDFNKYFQQILDKFSKCRDGRIFGCGIKDYTM